MHRPLRYFFWFVRLPTPTPAIPRLIKKEKSSLVSLVTRRRSLPTMADGARPSRPRRRSSLAGGGGAPSSPATAALLPRRWRSLSRRPPISSEALRARPRCGQMRGHGGPWLHRVGARTAAWPRGRRRRPLACPIAPPAPAATPRTGAARCRGDGVATPQRHRRRRCPLRSGR